MVHGKEQREKTQNLDYVIRSGIAGGVAGCVVRMRARKQHWRTAFHCFFVHTLPGQDCRCSIRSSQDSLPSQESCIRKVCWCVENLSTLFMQQLNSRLLQ